MKSTTAQTATLNQMQAAGFSVDSHERTVIRIKRGNDYRLIQQDGTQKRAFGAKR
jgi:hypothetical protein